MIIADNDIATVLHALANYSLSSRSHSRYGDRDYLPRNEERARNEGRTRGRLKSKVNGLANMQIGDGGGKGTIV